MTTYHQGRALELDQQASAANNPAHAQVYATRALMHATLAGLEVVTYDRDTDSRETHDHGVAELTAAILEAQQRADAVGPLTDAQAVAHHLWGLGYRPTWVDAAPQAVAG